LKTPSEFERAYLSAADPRAQSGFHGSPERWEAARRGIVDAIDRDGTFLDVGCANGLLMESVAEWSLFVIEPYGIDFAPGSSTSRDGGFPSGQTACWSPTCSRGGPRCGSTSCTSAGS
jgi:hypothetical protein